MRLFAGASAARECGVSGNNYAGLKWYSRAIARSGGIGVL
jgi:hypothetical protein